MPRGRLKRGTGASSGRRAEQAERAMQEEGRKAGPPAVGRGREKKEEEKWAERMREGREDWADSWLG